MLLSDLLDKMDLKTLVYVYDSHNHVLVYYSFLDKWLYSDFRKAKGWKVKSWKRDRHSMVGGIRVYVTPVNEETMRNET